MKLLKRIVLLPSTLMNMYFDMYTGGTKRPAYFDTESVEPTLLKLDQHFEMIKKEFENVQEHYRIPSYEDLDKYQYDHSKPTTKWKVFILNMMGKYPRLSEELCPETCRLIKEIPNVFSAMFSVLEPNRSIPAHEGPYRGYLRYHLGIKVPKDEPPSIRIKDTMYTWKEKESIMFDDSWDHEVINHSSEERVVLIVDILRPMPATPHKVNQFITKYFISSVYAKNVIKKYDEYYKNFTMKEVESS
jgi:aspartate beta-hydroxylase